MEINLIKKIIITLAILSVSSQIVFATQAEESPPEIEFGPPSLILTIPEDDNPPPPPEDDFENPKDPKDKDSSSKIKITKSNADPDNFNPAVTHTRINFSLSLNAIIEVRIQKPNGQTLLKLMDDKKINSGSHFANWYGTVDNKFTGAVVDNGTYRYKIIAKNPNTNDIEDTDEGEIVVNYFVAPKSDYPYNPDEAKATVIIQNEFKGSTSKTGPSIIIYFGFPLVYFLARKKILK